MAYPQSRSMNAELNEGATDGKYKKVIANRGGVVEPSTYKNRVDLDGHYYGIHEEPVKIRPDGKAVHTPLYVPTGEAQY